jgi:hypothetical protein
MSRFPIPAPRPTILTDFFWFSSVPSYKYQDITFNYKTIANPHPFEFIILSIIREYMILFIESFSNYANNRSVEASLNPLLLLLLSQ